MKKIEVVAAVIHYEDKILCCQRGRHKFHYLSEKWEFPGGKIEHGETPEEALKREIEEELNMKIYDLNYFITVEYSYDDFHIKMLTYLAHVTSPYLELNEHINISWSTTNELNSFDWAAADIPIVDALMMKVK